MNEKLLGLVFLNDKKFSDKSPDYKGAVMVEGKIYNVSLWKKVGKNSGKEFFSIALNEKKDSQVEQKQEYPNTYTNEVKEVAQAVGGKVEILDEAPLGEEDTPF